MYHRTSGTPPMTEMMRAELSISSENETREIGGVIFVTEMLVTIDEGVILLTDTLVTSLTERRILTSSSSETKRSDIVDGKSLYR